MSIIRTVFVLMVAVAASSCGGNKSCKSACDKLNTCALRSSGFSCDENCVSPQDGCAVCLNAKTCDEIKAGACTPDCPGASFTK